MDLVTAVKELRAHVGESQQAFATRLGLSIRALANYEKDRNPTGRALLSLASAADEAGRHDLADLFLAALGRELRLHQNVGFLSSTRSDDDNQLYGFLAFALTGAEQIRFARAFYDTMIRFIRATKPEVKSKARELLKAWEAAARDAWIAKS